MENGNFNGAISNGKIVAYKYLEGGNLVQHGNNIFGLDNFENIHAPVLSKDGTKLALRYRVGGYGNGTYERIRIYELVAGVLWNLVKDINMGERNTEVINGGLHFSNDGNKLYVLGGYLTETPGGNSSTIRTWSKTFTQFSESMGWNSNNHILLTANNGSGSSGTSFFENNILVINVLTDSGTVTKIKQFQ